MKIPVMIDAAGKIIAAADEGFHLSAYELEAEFADELVQDGHVEIYDERMIPLYRLADGTAVARTREEMDADYIPPAPAPDNNQRIADLEDAIAALEEGITSVCV